MPLCIEGSQQKLLPLYLHFLKQDLVWANDNQGAILDEIRRILLENIDEVERNARNVLTGSSSPVFVRLSGSDVISMTYQTKPSTNTTTILLSAESANKSTFINQAHFVVNLFVFPKGSKDMDEILAVNDM